MLRWKFYRNVSFVRLLLGLLQRDDSSRKHENNSCNSERADREPCVKRSFKACAALILTFTALCLWDLNSSPCCCWRLTRRFKMWTETWWTSSHCFTADASLWDRALLCFVFFHRYNLSLSSTIYWGFVVFEASVSTTHCVWCKISDLPPTNAFSLGS